MCAVLSRLMKKDSSAPQLQFLLLFTPADALALPRQARWPCCKSWSCLAQGLAFWRTAFANPGKQGNARFHGGLTRGVMLSVYTINWVAIFATANPTAELLRSVRDPEMQRSYTRAEQVSAYLAGVVIVLSTISVLLWAVEHVQWHAAAGGLFVGLVGAAIVRRVVAPRNLIGFGPPAITITNIALWLCS